jgi:hypothetical protein
MSTYLTPASPTVATGFLLQPESRVLLGTEYLHGSLEVSSWTYLTYTASIGLQAGKGLDLGMVESLGFSHVPTFEAVESANLQSSSVWVLTGEETTLSIGVRQFSPTVIFQALGTGTQYVLGTEQVMTFGGKCDMQTRPLTIEFTNIACGAPSSEDIASGVSGGALTLYNTFVSSGLPWDDINAGSLNTLALEFQVLPVLALALGNRLGNMYWF